MQRKYNNEELKKAAKQYGTRTEWIKKDANTCQAARRRKILDECCEHMKKLYKYRAVVRSVKGVESL